MYTVLVTKYHVTLASTSPRRADILAQMGISHTTINSGYDEAMHPSLPPEKLVVYLAEQKALHAEKLLKKSLVKSKQTKPEEIIIAADTIVVLHNRIYGKAHNSGQARKMLQELSGHQHQILTGLAVVIPPKTHTSLSTNTIHFKSLSDKEIDWYVNTREPLGKAGAYAAQGIGSIFIEQIEGSFSGIVGLPTEQLYEILSKHLDYESLVRSEDS